MQKTKENTLILQQLRQVQQEIDAIESRFRFTGEGELLDALSYQLLSLQARRRYFYTLLRDEKYRDFQQNFD